MNAHGTQNYFTQVEAALDCLIDMHLQACHIYSSVGFYFVDGLGGQKDVGYFFHELAEKKSEGAHHLLMRTHLRRCFLRQCRQRVPQAEWSSSLHAIETALALEKNINQALLDLNALGWAHADHHLCEFLVYHFLEEEVKIIQKMDDCLTNLHRLASPEAVLSESFGKLSLKRN
ncbi:Ferritin light chain [Heterocephalus glaber]|uniref:Ferritin n=1 Tax=Heterocephalus glaber TaxID=10181 RepID=G5B9L3_HETGA|nr:Ferritin light chain [Heterocephalus glaber]